MPEESCDILAGNHGKFVLISLSVYIWHDIFIYIYMLMNTDLRSIYVSNWHLHPPMLDLTDRIQHNKKTQQWHHDFTQNTTLSHMNFKPWNTHPHVPLDIGSALSPSDGLMEGCGCLLLRWSQFFSSQREIPKNSASDFWWRSTMASASSCMTIVPSQISIWGKYHEELLHLWAVGWCQKSLASFWWMLR